MKPQVIEVKVGGTYRTATADWTVKEISKDGLVYLTREDNRPGRYKLSEFRTWIEKRLS